MVTFDAQMLIWLLDPDAAPTDPETRRPIANARARLEHLVATLDESKTRIVVPTPALSEFLVHAGSARSQYLETLNRAVTFRVADFDQRAAVEAALAMRAAIERGDKRGGTDASWAKVKFDRQIVAISKVQGATTIYSDDADVATLAEQEGMSVVRLAEVRLPPEDAQGSLQLGKPEDQAPDADKD
jgi:predicted nucleic acid-binding protein